MKFNVTISVALHYLPAVFQSSDMDKRRQMLSHFNSGLHQLCRVCQEVMTLGHRQQQLPPTHQPHGRGGRAAIWWSSGRAVAVLRPPELYLVVEK